MNLRVDLILETEKRSASVINAKSLLRIVMIVVPAILILLGSLFGVGMWRINSDLKAREADMKEKGPKKDAAIQFRAEVGKNKQILGELEGWQKSRMAWCDELVKLQTVIPAEIQLASMKVLHNVEPADGVPARVYNMILKGKALGAKARSNVEALAEMEKSSTLASSMKDANVVDYKKSEDPSAKEDEYLFQIDTVYQPRKFR